ncbi:MAG: HAD-IA family hydrolase [Streptosporangiales bacterium]|nr:HAD-IA family hydrolase [Streptosporangiales bacterium]
MTTLRGVVFDFFGTLTVDQVPAERHRTQEPVARLLGVPLDAYLVALRDTFTERATGVYRDTAESLRALATQLGGDPSPESLTAAVASREDAERTMTRPRPGVLELLADLHAGGVPVGVLSDCTWETANIWPELPYAGLVDAVVFSVVVGARKPAPVMYELVARPLGLAPEEIVYVGDGGSNELTGARRAGMHPVLLRASLDEPAAVQALRYDAETDWTGEHVRDVGELRRLLADHGLLDGSPSSPA